MRLLHNKLLYALIIGLTLLLACGAPALAEPGEGFVTLVNKDNLLPADYVPEDMTALSPLMSAGNATLRQEAAEALSDMAAAAKAAGAGIIYGSSGYRSFDTQTVLYQRKVNVYLSYGYGQEQAEALGGTIVAPPGGSEHQSGLAIDITTSENRYAMEESFARTAAGKWLAEHCWEYGFILRYGEGKTDITGYVFEPWHFRYVGQPHAAYMSANDLTLEEYHQQLAGGQPLLYTDGSGQAWMICRLEDEAQAKGGYWSDITLCPVAPGSQAVIVTARLTPKEQAVIEAARMEQELQQMLESFIDGPSVFCVPWRHQGRQPSLQALLSPNGYDSAAQGREPGFTANLSRSFGA